MTTHGMLTSTELNSYISRYPIYNSRKNSLKNSNYIYIFLDEDTIIKNRAIREKNYAFSAISVNANYYQTKIYDEEKIRMKQILNIVSYWIFLVLE